MTAEVHYQYMRTQHAVPSSRRQPLTNTGNQLTAGQAAVQDPPAKHHKAPSSPPLPRQNTKTAPPSPPQLILDKDHGVSYSRVGFLGEGGFARVYEAVSRGGSRHAIKVVTKSSLKTTKAKTKLFAEIKIHRSLQHPNIVDFSECFEDGENVYMVLELCEAGSLMDMLRRRRRFTEPETRFFMVQLLGACHYMHTNQVIHRDLKLGNLFLDHEMNVKVGDFGLAALIENPGERKKTICGTPNYIAPEVLFDTANGHSFEVDTWSIGVILYTLCVGRPPFQTKDVKAIYKRIRENEYDFPQERPVSMEVQGLIQSILTQNPNERPTLHGIVDHDFFTNGTFPAQIPRSAQEKAPDFRHVSRTSSKINLERLRKKVMLDDDEQPIRLPPPSSKASTSMANASAMSSSAALALQEREFKKAVQPSSPISALLGAARQPLLHGPGAPSGREREQPLIRKLQAVAKEGRSIRSGLGDSQISSLTSSVMGSVGGNRRGQMADLQNIEEEESEPETKEEVFVRRKELEAQKARIVAQMTSEPATASANLTAMRQAAEMEEMENVPPPTNSNRGLGSTREKESRPGSSGSSSSGKLKEIGATATTLIHAFEAKGRGKLFRDPRQDIDLPDARIFIVSWVDYCNKYGMGYALTDGTVGVHFNDSTTIVLSPDKENVDYIGSKAATDSPVRTHCTLRTYEDGLKSKIYLLKHFERYIMDKLYGEYPFTFEDEDRVQGMDYVQKYLRMKHVIVFVLSCGALQFNFYDHTKLILSSNGLLVTHINKDYELTRWSLSELMARSLRPATDKPAETKLVSRLMEKLKYCKEVLTSIKSAGAAPQSPTHGDE